MSSSDFAEHHRWMREPDFAWVVEVGMTISAIAGRTADECVRIFGGDPAKKELATVVPYLHVSPGVDHFPLFVMRADENIVLIEISGWRGSDAEVAQCASDSGGEFFSVSWSITGAHQIMHAYDGLVDACFRPDVFEIVDSPDIAAGIPEWAVGVNFDVFDVGLMPQAVSLGLMERIMGTRLLPEWMRSPQPMILLPHPSRG